jgi:ribonuclease P protein component
MVRRGRHRLTGAGSFARILRSGLRRDGDYLQLVSVVVGDQRGRAGFVIGRKALPLAVDRNRVRRMLRVIVRDARPVIEGLDVIVRLKRRVSRAEFPMVAAEAARLLATLGPSGSAP